MITCQRVRGRGGGSANLELDPLGSQGKEVLDGVALPQDQDHLPRVDEVESGRGDGGDGVLHLLTDLLDG
jgi:hypothetical protein